MKGFLVALGFLTIVPVKGGARFDGTELERSLVWFPVVGLFLGFVLFLVDSAISLLFPPLVTSALLVAVFACLTGAFHLDGLADTCDAFFSTSSPERRLSIMKDSRIGTMGAVGLILCLVLKVVALSSLDEELRGKVLLLMPVYGRWGNIALARLVPYVGRETGLGRPVSGEAVTFFRYGLASVFTLVIGAAVLGTGGIWLTFLAFFLVVVMKQLSEGKIRGITGDVMGATIELVELLVLLAAPLVVA
jgi:adenosylcobinamide-GDP ribazoletransferase